MKQILAALLVIVLLAPSVFAAAPDLDALQRDLQTLAALHRPIGSSGEQAAVSYLQSRFLEMGYTVTLQPYTNAGGLTGTNVIATRKSAPDADMVALRTAIRENLGLD